MPYINLILLILLIILVVYIGIILFYIIIKREAKKQEQPNLFTNEYIYNMDNGKAKDILVQLYSSYQHNYSVYNACIAVCLAVITSIIVFYNNYTENNYNRELLYLITNISLILLLFLYIIVINTYIKIYNSNKFIKMFENKLDFPITNIIECGHYKTLGDNIKALYVLNIIIIVIIFIVPIAGMISLIDNIKEKITITILYIICFVIFKIIISTKTHKIKINN